MTDSKSKSLAALPANMQSLRIFLARLAQALDTLASAPTARLISEWRMRGVQNEINGHLGFIRAAEALSGRLSRLTARAVAARMLSVEQHRDVQKLDASTKKSNAQVDDLTKRK